MRKPAHASRREDCSIIALDKFIQATRDSGYKGTASAISELVDNALQASAQRIEISIERRADEPGACDVSPFLFTAQKRQHARTR